MFYAFGGSFFPLFVFCGCVRCRVVLDILRELDTNRPISLRHTGRAVGGVTTSGAEVPLAALAGSSSNESGTLREPRKSSNKR